METLEEVKTGQTRVLSKGVQRVLYYLPASLYGLVIVCIRVVIFSGVCLERRPGGKEGKKEENIAKQSDHVLKP